MSIFKFEKFKYNPEDSIKKNSFVVGGVKFTLISDVENSNNQDKIVEQINFFKKEILYFEKKLENKNFITKAPKKVVDAEKKKIEGSLA